MTEMFDYSSVENAKKANKARELILHAQALYVQAGIPKDILMAMQPHIKAAIQGYVAKHVKGAAEANPEQSVAHITTLGSFGGSPYIGENLQRLLDKHGL